MRKVRCFHMGCVAAVTTFALISASLMARAEEPANKELGLRTASEQVGVKQAQRGEPQRAKPIGTPRNGLDVAQASNTSSDAVAADVAKSAGTVVAMSPSSTAVSGTTASISKTRAPGDNNVLFYDWLAGSNTFCSTCGNNTGDDVFIAAAPSGQAWSLDEVSFGALRIASTSIPTWARVRVWRVYDEPTAIDPLCSQQPVHANLMGTVIVNLGVDTDALCNATIRVRVNLVTGEVFDLFNSVVLAGASIVSNTSPIGSIPLGVGGDTGVYITIEFGQSNGSGGVMAGPNDACAANPGGRPIWTTLSGAGGPPAAGDTTTVFWTDDDLDGNYECDEGPYWFGQASGTKLALRGAAGNDCDTDGIIDEFEIANNPALDQLGPGCAAASPDGILDSCQTTDCNNNSVFDCYDVTGGTSQDCNSDAVPDECQIAGNDCNADSIPDDCQLAGNDCNANLIPDECDVDPSDPDGSGDFWRDCDVDGVPDGCQRFFFDCNQNGVSDYCDILFGEANDSNADGVPDKCGLTGKSVVLDFEEKGDIDFNYVVGTVHDQPFETGLVNADWAVYDDTAELAFLTAPGFADVTAGSLATGCAAANTKHLVLKEQNPMLDWAVDSPHIFFADPTTETVSGSTPRVQEIKLKMQFSAGASAVDWDCYFGSIFDTTFINASRIMVSFDSDTGGVTRIVLYTDTVQITSVDWTLPALNTTHELRIVLDYSNQLGIDPLTNAGKVYWDGVQIATFTPTVAAGEVLNIDKVWFDEWDDTALGNPTANSQVKVDCITLTRSEEAIACSSLKLPNGEPSGDCDGDGICDVYQLVGNDRDGDSVLDVCEGYCDDCNHNFIPDSADIAAGTLVDTTPANGIPDACEKTNYNFDFTNFVVGPVNGQFGWTDGAGLDAQGEIRNDNVMTGATQQYLVVKNVVGNGTGVGFVFGPRQQSLGDGDMELWSWKMRVRDPAGGSTNDWGRVFIEIADLCADAPANPTIVEDIIDRANVGLQVSRLNTPEGVDGTEFDGGKIGVYVLGHPGNVVQYQPAATIDDVQGDVLNNTWAAGLRIHNNSGVADSLGAFWAADQNHIAFPPVGNIAIGPAGTGETIPPQIPTLNDSRWRGGDRQLWIRTDGDYGATLDIEFLFDDFRYTTATDCDGDGQVDSGFLQGDPTHDANGDGVPDRCQDCDNDCLVIPVTAGNKDCLDPCEINPVAAGCGDGTDFGTALDCNTNGIPDRCDVDQTDNPNGQVIDAFGRPAQRLPVGGDGVYRFFRGGGSCDFNTNAVPDECTPGFQDCNNNGCHDSFELATAGFGGTATNVNGPATPIDECEPDCNHNSIPDENDLALGVAGGGSQDNDEFGGFETQDGVPDECCVDGPGGVVIAASGDMDHDGNLDAKDYQLLQRCAGQTPPCGFPGCVQGAVTGSATGDFDWDGLQCGCGDYNGDGLVDTCDLQIFQTLITGP